MGKVPKIRVGPVGWPHKDWSGIAYQKRKTAGYREALLTGRKFDMPETLVERYREFEPISTGRNITPRLFRD